MKLRMVVRTSMWPKWLRDTLGVGWVLVAGVAVLLPSLAHGIYLGPYDILSKLGLTAHSGGPVHNPTLRDVITLFIPSTQLAWMQVHQGHLPLWNPYNGLGMPLAFNWESAPFGLPAVIGYLAPVRYAFTIGVLVSVAVAGSGAYVFGRVLRLGVHASAFVGTVFVLSGPMMALLGWSATSVGSWSGWLFATAALVLRGGRVTRPVCAFAFVLAMTVYSGHPETAFLLVASVAVYVAAVLVRRAPRMGQPGPILRPIGALAIGAAGGAALSAPLVLPGLQLISQSGRAATGTYQSLTTPDHGFFQLIFQGFDGLPVAGSHWFGSLSYQWTAGYVGVIVLALGVVAIAVRWRRPEVLGLFGVAVIMASLVLVPGIPSVVGHLPVAGDVILTRALIPLAFAAAVLGGIGLDALVRDHAVARVRRWAGWSFAGFDVLLAGIWLIGRGHLPAYELRIRNQSFLWPVIGVVVGLTVVAFLGYIVRRDSGSSNIRAAHVAASTLLAVETVFLVVAGAPIWSSSSVPLAATPAIASLKNVVGNSLVGLGADTCVASTIFGTSELGIVPQVNEVFGVREFAFYEPLAPQGYYSVWQRLTGSSGGNAKFYEFCPAVTSVSMARRFGINYLLEDRGTTAPAGSVLVGPFGNEYLYRIPGAFAAVLIPTPAGRSLPSADANGSAVPLHQSDPGMWRLTTDSSTPAVLRLHITDVPGLRATVDGRPVALQSYLGLMPQLHLPPGRHNVAVRYWPIAFSYGLLLAFLGFIALISGLVLDLFRRRQHSS